MSGMFIFDRNCLMFEDLNIVSMGSLGLLSWRDLKGIFFLQWLINESSLRHLHHYEDGVCFVRGRKESTSTYAWDMALTI
jgi:hypothetical protein